MLQKCKWLYSQYTINCLKHAKIIVLNKHIWYTFTKVLTAKLTHKGTYAQKSSTVSNAVMSLRFAVHSLVRSFLKNHRAHLFCRGCLMSESGAIMAPSSVGSSSSSSTLSSYNSKAWYTVNNCNIIINADRKNNMLSDINM